jgi:diguanylate cyclase (GGDEF)-like protein
MTGSSNNFAWGRKKDRLRAAKPRATWNRLADLFALQPLMAGVAGTVVAISMVGLSLVTLYNGRAEALNHARETSANLVAIIEGTIARDVELYKITLKAIVDSAEQPQMMALPSVLRRQAMFDRATTASYIGGPYLMDAKGQVVIEGDLETARPGLFTEREYFRVQAGDPNAGVYFSHPYRDGFGRLSIGISQRVNAQDGSFAGIALLAVRIDYFRTLLQNVDVGRLGSIFIIREDGTFLVRKPYVDSDVGRNVSGSSTFPIMTGHPSGAYVAKSPMDGVRRLYAYARIPNTPFIVVVAPAEQDVLASWRSRSIAVGGLTLIFGFCFIALSWLLAISLKQRAIVQAELIRLAGTDALTGLDNRRVLDTRIDEEWRRARRNGTSLSALFIDIDHFKRFNDTYGHATGDNALAMVAECIESVIRRPGDIAARYGGEEFVVLLPNTSSAGTSRIAEELRARVEAMGIAHAPSPYGVVTVSIGCTTSFASKGRDAVSLLSDADEALYIAKTSGRNRVTASVPSPEKSVSSQGH